MSKKELAELEQVEDDHGLTYSELEQLRRNHKLAYSELEQLQREHERAYSELQQQLKDYAPTYKELEQRMKKDQEDINKDFLEVQTSLYTELKKKIDLGQCTKEDCKLP